MYIITKKFNFEASHQLTGLPESHPCSRIHGHSYKVILKFRALELNEIGFVIDYRELDEFKAYLDKVYDHRHLNHLFSFNPTAENMAKFFYELVIQMFPQLYAVTVKETDKTSATYEFSLHETLIDAFGGKENG